MYIETERKYRPKTLNDFVFPDEKTKEIVSAYATGEISRPLILNGLNGTGKSLLAELIPNAIEKGVAEVNRVNASDLNSNKAVREIFSRGQLFDKLFTNGQRYNYYVIEELNIDSKASDAFRVILDERSGVDLTIITSNEIARIDKGVRSRSEVLYVPPCEPHMFLPRAKFILEAEGVDLDEQALLPLLQAVHEEQADNRAYYKKLDELLRSV